MRRRRLLLAGASLTALLAGGGEARAQAFFGAQTGNNPVTATEGATARTLQNRAADSSNVVDFGADPTGSSSSSTAFAAAMIAATGKLINGGSSYNSAIYVPPGHYSGSATLPENMPMSFVGTSNLTTFGLPVDGAPLQSPIAAGWLLRTNQPGTTSGIYAGCVTDVTSFAAGYEKPCAYIYAETSDPTSYTLTSLSAEGLPIWSVGANGTGDAVAMDLTTLINVAGAGASGSGIGATAIGGRSNVYNLYCGIAAGSDGLPGCSEWDLENHGTDQPLINQWNTKLAFNLISAGPNPGTVGMYVGGSGRWHNGIVTSQNGYVTPSKGNWAASFAYSMGDTILNPNNNLIYIVMTAGTSGSTAPIGVGGGISDGSVTWAFSSPQSYFLRVLDSAGDQLPQNDLFDVTPAGASMAQSYQLGAGGPTILKLSDFPGINIAVGNGGGFVVGIAGNAATNSCNILGSNSSCSAPYTLNIGSAASDNGQTGHLSISSGALGSQGVASAQAGLSSVKAQVTTTSLTYLTNAGTSPAKGNGLYIGANRAVGYTCIMTARAQTGQDSAVWTLTGAGFDEAASAASARQVGSTAWTQTAVSAGAIEVLGAGIYVSTTYNNWFPTITASSGEWDVGATCSSAEVK